LIRSWHWRFTGGRLPAEALSIGLFAACAALLAGGAVASPPAAPTDVRAIDTPGDSGRSIQIEWNLSPDDGAGAKTVTGYEIMRGDPSGGNFAVAGVASAGQKSFRDSDVKDGEPHTYKVAALAEGADRAESPVAGPVASSPQWFATGRVNVFLIAILLFGTILYFIERGKRGRPPFIRRIAGLDALEEAIGRATEMGRPIVYSTGTQDMSDVQTVASITILAHVARKTASYDTRLMVPNRYSIVMTTARETVKEACLSVGRPDSYREDDIFYVSDEQFGYVVGVAGLIVRERPAACLYLGFYAAESLILAETGNSIGAIQIGGTAQPSQLPFFVAACDYTLIGEELFAASAYLSGEPRQLGSLRGQDIGKLLAIGGIIAGSLLATILALTGSSAAGSALAWLRSVFANASV
jgi:hypothetical protein